MIRNPAAIAFGICLSVFAFAQTIPTIYLIAILISVGIIAMLYILLSSKVRRKDPESAEEPQPEKTEKTPVLVRVGMRDGHDLQIYGTHLERTQAGVLRITNNEFLIALVEHGVWNAAYVEEWTPEGKQRKEKKNASAQGSVGKDAPVPPVADDSGENRKGQSADRGTEPAVDES